MPRLPFMFNVNWLSLVHFQGLDVIAANHPIPRYYVPSSSNVSMIRADTELAELGTLAEISCVCRYSPNTPAIVFPSLETQRHMAREVAVAERFLEGDHEYTTWSFIVILECLNVRLLILTSAAPSK
ncbi:hypothetical protein MKW98_013827 [Papaver atlanticum]|uniref:Uncharacterized protein n=1 Tax=Papaver atlanticum TaxID=357466 RepID=A0AAD4TAX2_9MAGN|nr:hypothetical protein MKW98_013827 [Papaver atlanticum]